MIEEQGKPLDRYVGLDLDRRPYFINERGWRVFSAYFFENQSIYEIATENGLSINWTRRILHDVDAQLLLPRKSAREWIELTIDSPVQDLGVSMRTLNQLRDLGCATVADVLSASLTGSAIGAGARSELFECLRGHGLRHSADESTPPNADLKRLEKQLHDLSRQMDESMAAWNVRLRNMEARLHKLSSKARG
jgi:hypothetical protein